jgi:hypothetical protein
MGKLNYALIGIIAIFLLALAYCWYHRDEIARQFVPMPAPEIKVEYREGPERIVYLNRPALEREDLLPERVKHDPDKEVTAVTTVPEHNGDTTVIAVIDTDTGETSLDIRQERPSLFALESLKTIGIRCDVTTSCNELEVYGSWEFLRIGSVHLEAYGEVSRGRAFIGLGAEYRF